MVSYSPARFGIQNINTLSLVSAVYIAYGNFHEVYGTFVVYPTTSGSWGTVIFSFDLPSVSSQSILYGEVAGVYTGGSTTPISGTVSMCNCSPSGAIQGGAQVILTSQNPANAYTVNVHLIYKD
jgi:hypothetical protein